MSVKNVRLLISILILAQSTSADAAEKFDASFLNGTWSCNQETSFDDGLVVKIEDKTVIDMSALTSVTKATIDSFYIDNESIRSRLYVHSVYEIDVLNDVLTVVGSVEELRVISDELGMLTPEFLESFRQEGPPVSARIHKVDENTVRLLGIEHGNTINCSRVLDYSDDPD